ncbi:MAG TPA: hypothetical protein VGJ87_11875 [Roseiflexaceae bacterium]
MTESPTQQPDEQDDQPVICPFCGSDETELYAMFGSLLLTEQYYCRACRSVFERIRDDEPSRGAKRGHGG